VIIKPIPKHLLPHTVEYEEYQEGDGITKESGFLPAVTLSFVRVQYQSIIKKTNNSEDELFDAILFYDVVNSSSSSDFTFTKKSKITHNGKTMAIEKVNPVEAFKLHHYEIGMK